MEHLALEVFDFTGSVSRFARLPEDTVITITDTSEIFDKSNVWSHPFTLNTRANAHLFGTAGELHGARLHQQFDKRRARLWVEGVPLYFGRLRLADEAEVDAEGNIDVTLESGHKIFEDMLEDMNARDVPMLGEHLLGVAVWRDRLPSVRVTYGLYTGSIRLEERTDTFNLANIEGGLATRWPRYVEHSGTFKKADQTDYVVRHSDTINTDTPYDDNSPNAHPYCNVDIGYRNKNEDGEAERGYTIHQVVYKTHPGTDVRKAWPNTAPCFFVMYWLRALMEHLGIHIEENQMQDVEDLRRLFMMNTLCAYDEPETEPSAGGTGKNMRLTGVDFLGREPSSYDTSESGGVITELNVTTQYQGSTRPYSKEDFEVVVSKVEKASDETILGHPAYASSDCFPNVEARKIIEALQSGFGVRLVFNNDFTKVRVVLLRNVFRSKEVVELQGEILSQTKEENNIKGFLMTYGGEGAAFKLPVFDNILVKKHDKDKTGEDYVLTSADYGTIVRAVSGINKHLYYTNDGNAYLCKIDQEAKRFKDFFPSLFEVAGFMDAVDGDCTGEEGTFENLQLGFTPLIVNDANGKPGKDIQGRSNTTEQKFFVFVDEDMEATSHPVMNASSSPVTEKRKTEINGDMLCGKVHWEWIGDNGSIDVDAELYVFEQIALHLYDNYKQNDEGVAPIETHDWGLTLGVMRGSGSDAKVQYAFDPDDQEGNDTWDILPGSSATAHPDTCDDYGREWDYNGANMTVITTAVQAEDALNETFPDGGRNAPFNTPEKGYITGTRIYKIPDDQMTYHNVLLATEYLLSGAVNPRILSSYLYSLYGLSAADMLARDASPNAGANLIVEIDSRYDRGQTLTDLCRRAYGPDTSEIRLDNGIGSRYGRFSLKPRAEKPNPYFDASQPEGIGNTRFLPIEDKNLRGRGLADQFYREYSHWIRNARVAHKKQKIDLAQLLRIDKTVKTRIGDVTGFIKKMQVQVSMQNGLEPVDFEILYI